MTHLAVTNRSARVVTVDAVDPEVGTPPAPRRIDRLSCLPRLEGRAAVASRRRSMLEGVGPKDGLGAVDLTSLWRAAHEVPAATHERALIVLERL